MAKRRQRPQIINSRETPVLIRRPIKSRKLKRGKYVLVVNQQNL